MMQATSVTSPVHKVTAYQKIQKATPSGGYIINEQAKKQTSPAAIITISTEGHAKYKAMLDSKNKRAKPTRQSLSAWKMPVEMEGIRKGDIISALHSSKTQGEVATILAPIVNSMAQATTSVLLGNEGDMVELSAKYSIMHARIEAGAIPSDGKAGLAAGAQKLLAGMVSVSAAIKESLKSMSENKNIAGHRARLTQISHKLFEFLDYSSTALQSEEA